VNGCRIIQRILERFEG
jgi:hypothetical protein